MLFSIVVPVYCVESNLKQCVDSILIQTAQQFELVLVDDGSPDGSPAICDAYAKADDRVRVIHQENKGVSAARNAGIHASTGDYILLLDSDDFWIEKDMLAELAEFLKKRIPIRFCSGSRLGMSRMTRFESRTLPSTILY